MAEARNPLWAFDERPTDAKRLHFWMDVCYKLAHLIVYANFFLCRYGPCDVLKIWGYLGQMYSIRHHFLCILNVKVIIKPMLLSECGSRCEQSYSIDKHLEGIMRH